MRFDYRFCPVCAAALCEKHVFGRSRPSCASCGFVHFQEPKVAVAAVIRDDQNRVLLVKRSVEPAIGQWAVPSGFLDMGEDPRQATKREVREETGMEIQIERVLDVFPMQSAGAIEGVTIFFSALTTGGTLAPADDVSDAAWVSISELGSLELAFPDVLSLILAP